MTVGLNDGPRFMVPRWRRTGDTVQRRHLSTLRAPKPHEYSADISHSEIDAWLDNPSQHLGLDLLERLRFDANRAEDAAKIAARLHEMTPINESVAFVVQRTLSVTARGLAAPRSSSRSHPRTRIRRDPRDAHAWADLALAQAISGNSEAARRSIENAVFLAREDRHVLRSASAFFDHIDEPDRAVFLLDRTKAAQEDPWLLASQIAMSQAAQRKPAHLKAALSLLKSERFSPRDMTELAAALGTEELSAGNDRRARRLFEQAILNPTENAVAQIQSLSKHLRFDVPDGVLSNNDAHEALARAAVQERSWREALDRSAEWFDDQPFSESSAAYASYVASVGLEDFESASRIASEGLRANPRSFQLWNNLAYAKASAGEVNDGDWALVQARQHASEPRDQVFLEATSGLLAYRSGNAYEGRNKYLEAISLARSLGHAELARQATLFFALEEIRNRSIVVPQLLDEVRKHRFADAGSLEMQSRVLQMAETRGLA